MLVRTPTRPTRPRFVNADPNRGQPVDPHFLVLPIHFESRMAFRGIESGRCDRRPTVSIDLDEVGAAAARDAAGRWQVHIGIYLPGISFDKGYRVQVRVIHERDQFVRSIEPEVFDLFWHDGSALDLWDVTVDLSAGGAGHFGQEGKYLYRFQLLRGREPVTTFADPFGRAAGLGSLSAFTADSSAQPFAWNDGGFRVPEVDELVVYELHVGEFNETFGGVAAQLDYLTGLGVNALELMPVTNVKEDVEWGYTPLSYFAPDDRYGGPEELKLLVDACHQRGVAVVLDVVYAHAHPEFPYNLVYASSGESNPMMGQFAGEFFPQRVGTDYSKEFTRDYFLTVNGYWLEEYHVDGFRYDYVPGMLDGPTGDGYANLVFRTYRHAQQFGRFSRFDAGDGRSLIIQCAEHLPDARGILRTTYSNTCWQNGLLDEAGGQVHRVSVDVSFAHQLDPELIGYPSEFRNPATDEVLPVAPFQYLESHDHSRFITRFGVEPLRDLLELPYGDRNNFFKIQPYVIALYTAKGIPMLWHGQEFAENWSLPGGMAQGRTLYGRPLHWEYFYDQRGRALVRLYRILGTLRRRHRALRSRGYFFYYDDPFHRRDGIIAYRRAAAATATEPAESLVVILNFTDVDAEAWIPWPKAGHWQEQIDQADNPQLPVQVARDGQWLAVRVPSSYGAAYLHI